MKVIDIVHNVLLSFLDGGVNRVERDSAYYRLVTGTISIPSRIMKNNSLFRKLNECADAILTGSDPDPRGRNNIKKYRASVKDRKPCLIFCCQWKSHESISA